MVIIERIDLRRYGSLIRVGVELLIIASGICIINIGNCSLFNLMVYGCTSMGVMHLFGRYLLRLLFNYETMNRIFTKISSKHSGQISYMAILSFCLLLYIHWIHLHFSDFLRNTKLFYNRFFQIYKHR